MLSKDGFIKKYIIRLDVKNPKYSEWENRIGLRCKAEYGEHCSNDCPFENYNGSNDFVDIEGSNTCIDGVRNYLDKKAKIEEIKK